MARSGTEIWSSTSSPARRHQRRRAAAGNRPVWSARQRTGHGEPTSTPPVRWIALSAANTVRTGRQRMPVHTPAILRRSLQARLIAGFLLVAGLLVGVGLLNVREQNALASRATAVAERDLGPLADLAAAQALAKEITVVGLLKENLALLPPAVRDPAEIRQTNQRLAESVAAMDPVLQRLRGSAPAELRGDVDKLIATYNEFWSSHLARVAERNPKKVAQLNARTSGLYIEVHQGFADMAGLLTKDGAAQRAATAEMNASSRNRTLLLLLAGVALSLVLAGLVARSIRRPIAGMVEALNTVADGDLTRDVDVHASDEVGQMAEALRRALRGVPGDRNLRRQRGRPADRHRHRAVRGQHPSRRRRPGDGEPRKRGVDCGRQGPAERQRRV